MKSTNAIIRDLGKVIKDNRINRGYWSLNKLSHYSGVSKGRLSKIENGGANITIETLFKISIAMGRDPAFLLQQAIRL